MWTGGTPPIGYSCKNKKLVRNKDAKIIQNIFVNFANDKKIEAILEDLKQTTLQIKSRNSFTKNQIYRILNNQLYIGKVTHLGKVYKGKHRAIISKEIWDNVQKKLKEQKTNSGRNKNSKYPALLKGLVFCKYCNCAMTPSYTKKGKKIFHYYTCMNLIRYGSNACHLKRINADELENFIEPEIVRILQNPEIAIYFLNINKVTKNNVGFIWKKLAIEHKQIIAQELIDKITIDHFEIFFNPKRDLISTAESKNFIRNHTNIIKTDDESLTKLQQEILNRPIKEMIRKAALLKKKYQNLSLSKIATLENKSKSQIARIFRMNYLIPETQSQILSLTFQNKLKVEDFESFPKNTKTQRKWFEFLCKKTELNKETT